MRVTMNLSFELDVPLTDINKAKLKAHIENVVNEIADSVTRKNPLHTLTNAEVSNVRALLSIKEARSLGGKRSAEIMTRADRQKRAVNAARVRWAKSKGTDDDV